MNSEDIDALVGRLGAAARAASAALAKASAAQRRDALRGLAAQLQQQRQALQQANQQDLEAAQAAGLQGPMLDRLRLDDKTLQTCAQGCEQLAAMPDIVGEMFGFAEQPSGIRVGQMRVPLGVFAMIYESRPNVTIEAASLAIKSGNACILRGGSEATASNRALLDCVAAALVAAGLPADAVQLVPVTDRAAVGALLQLQASIDVVVPRGGNGVI
ncbi:MAG: aldehyde dehydrogenase family protein, partial [Burkholderiaceae bacterium]